MALQTLVRSEVHPPGLLCEFVEVGFQALELCWVSHGFSHALGAAKDAAQASRAGPLARTGNRKHAAAAITLLAAATPHEHRRRVPATHLPAHCGSRSWTRAESLDVSARHRWCNRGLREEGSRCGVLNARGNSGLRPQRARLRLVEHVVASHDLSRALRRELLHSSSGLLIDGFVQPMKFHQSRSQQLPKTRILAHGVQPRRRAPRTVAAILALGRRARLPRVEAASRSGACSLSQASATARAHDARKEKQIEMF